MSGVTDTSSQWQTLKAGDVRPGQRIRTPDGTELTATRIERPFFGAESMLAFIEDTPERWFKRPAPVDSDVEVLTAT
jgi:hypothetical protein